MLLFDNTRIAAFESSPRYYYWRHVRHLVPETHKTASTALVTGSAWHAAMDVIWAEAASSLSDSDLFYKAWDAFCKSWESSGMPAPEFLDAETLAELGPRSPAHLQEVVLAYIEQSRPLLSKLQIIAIEQPFVVPLSEKDDNELFYIGRIDKIFRRSDRRLGAADHKTTTSYQGRGSDVTFRSSWMNSWSGAPQLDGYLFALHCLYGEDPFIWVDGVLLHKGVIDRFTRIPLERRFELLDSWHWRTVYWVSVINQHQRVLEDLRAENKAKDLRFLPCFPCGRHCSTYSTCPYKDLCRARANPETWDIDGPPPPGYTELAWSPLNVDERTLTTEAFDQALKNQARKTETI